MTMKTLFRTLPHVFAALAFAALMLFAPAALAKYVPPAITGHVTDPGGRLTSTQVAALNAKLESYKIRTTNEVAIFLPVSLEGYSIDDVGFETGQTWKLGAGKNDNGVLLLIAPVERKVRIEVGKGAEGSLTDLQSNDIIQTMKPAMRAGDWNQALDVGTDGIIAALDKGGTGAAAGAKPAPKPATAGDILVGLIVLAIMFGIPILFVVAIATSIARAFSSNGRGANRGWASGSSWSSDSGGGSSWSSSDSGGSSFGSDFSGGGGSFGGGGSSDSF